ALVVDDLVSERPRHLCEGGHARAAAVGVLTDEGGRHLLGRLAARGGVPLPRSGRGGAVVQGAVCPEAADEREEVPVLRSLRAVRVVDSVTDNGHVMLFAVVRG